MDDVVRSITVRGEGTVEVKPDSASLQIGVQAIESTASVALTRSNESAAQLIEALKAAGVAAADIATSNVSLFAQYGSNGRKVTGYESSNSLTVRVRDLSRAGAVIDAAAAAAGDRLTLGGISFFVAEPEALLGAARADAIANAKQRADEYARAAGASVGDVLTISEVSVGEPSPMFRVQAMSSAPIEAGTQELSASVTVVFALV